MTRFLSLAAFALLFAPLASAQVGFGVRAGLNTTTVIPDNDVDIVDRQPRLGFVGGAYAEVPVGPVAIQPEVLFSQKGVNREDAANGDVRVNYLEVPVLLKAGLPVSDLLDVDVFAGPALAVKLSDSVDGDFDGGSFNQTTVAVAVGGAVASGPFGVDLRYTFDVKDATEGAANDFRNRAFSVTGIYRFGR